MSLRDPATQTVALRTVGAVGFDPARVLVGQGLATGGIVDTAGVRALRPGQKSAAHAEGSTQSAV